MFIFLGDFGCSKTIPKPPPISQQKTKIMQPHLVRMLIEKEDLEDKINKIRKVFDSELWNDIEPQAKALLYIQHRAMQTYLECLEQRIKIS